MKSKRDKKIIVLIEDEEVMTNLLADKLSRAGYEVKTAPDGIAGLELIRAVKPDLVLLDMMLPRLNGFGVLEELREEKLLPDLPVMIISNSGQPIEIDRALQLGVREYVIKVNFDPSEIVDKVEHLLSEVVSSDRPYLASNGPIVGNVLLVEDDVFLSELLERKMTQSQIKMFHAIDAAGVRAVLAKETIDVILLDVILPGIDGITLLKELKANDALKSIPVVIISNLGQREEMQKGIDAGAAYYLVKANSTTEEIISKAKEFIKK